MGYYLGMNNATNNTVTEYANQIAPLFNAAMRQGMTPDAALIAAIDAHGKQLERMAVAMCNALTGRRSALSDELMAVAVAFFGK
jgi:hypothetical protein